MTIYDIAKEAGVAASTVSRVVNDKPGVKAETREKIQALLKKYDYTPDAAARGLVMQSSKLVGILVEDIRVSHHIESAFVVEQELTRDGFTCIIMGTGSAEEKKVEAIRHLEQRRVEGAVLIGSMFSGAGVRDSIVKHLSKIPVVLVNGVIDLPNVSSVIIDEEKGVETCVELLKRKGRQHIAFISDQDSPSNRLKISGYRKKLKALGEEDRIVLGRVSEGTYEAGYQATKALLSEHPEVDGIIYSIDLIATGGVRAALDLGYSIPDTLALVGIDNSVYGQICVPSLSTLDNRMRDSSVLAAEMLRSGMEGEILCQKHVLSASILERETS